MEKEIKMSEHSKNIRLTELTYEEKYPINLLYSPSGAFDRIEKMLEEREKTTKLVAEAIAAGIYSREGTRLSEDSKNYILEILRIAYP